MEKTWDHLALCRATAMVMSGPGLLMEPKSKFIALMQPKTVVMSVGF